MLNPAIERNTLALASLACFQADSPCNSDQRKTESHQDHKQPSMNPISCNETIWPVAKSNVPTATTPCISEHDTATPPSRHQTSNEIPNRAVRLARRRHEARGNHRRNGESCREQTQPENTGLPAKYSANRKLCPWPVVAHRCPRFVMNPPKPCFYQHHVPDVATGC